MPKGKRMNASDALLSRAGYGATSTLRGSGYRHLATGQAASFASVSAAVKSLNGGRSGLAKQIISHLASKTPARQLRMKTAKRGFKGVIFNLEFPDRVAKHLQDAGDAAGRVSVVNASRTFIADKLYVDEKRLLPHIQSVLETMIRDIVMEYVYEAGAPELIYYASSDGEYDRKGSYTQREQRSGALAEAAVSGLTIQGDTIHWSMDDNMAPYWLWVDQGHRVFLPDGEGGSREIGTWVSGRKYVRAIELAITRVADSMQAIMNQKYKGVITDIGSWAVHGEKYTQIDPGSVVHFPHEFGGYTDEFFQYVGVR